MRIRELFPLCEECGVSEINNCLCTDMRISKRVREEERRERESFTINFFLG